MINQFYSVYTNLCWFISMALFDMLGAVKPLLIVMPLLIAIAPFLVKGTGFDNDSVVKRQLSFMPIFWVVSGLWGGSFRFNGAGSPCHFAEYFIWLPIILFVLYCRRCLKLSQKSKKVIWVFVIVNGYFLLLISFFAGMAISGTWI